MQIQFDDRSRKTILRFVLKAFAAFALSAWSIFGALFGAPTFLVLFAIWAVITAVLRNERFADRAFNHWDEAFWLVITAGGLLLIHSLLTT